MVNMKQDGADGVSGNIQLTAEDLAKRSVRPSFPTIFQTALRIQYKIGLSNATELQDFGDGIHLRTLLGRDKLENGIATEKNMSITVTK